MELKDLDMGLGVTDRIIDRVRQLVGVEHVFGEPIERGDTTVIPVAKIRTGGGGGGGGGGDDHAGGSGEGGGFGVIAKPVGVYVIRDGTVGWEPSIDVNQVVSGAFLTVISFFVFGWLRSR